MRTQQQKGRYFLHVWHKNAETKVYNSHLPRQTAVATPQLRDDFDYSRPPSPIEIPNKALSDIGSAWREKKNMRPWKLGQDRTKHYSLLFFRCKRKIPHKKKKRKVSCLSPGGGSGSPPPFPGPNPGPSPGPSPGPLAKALASMGGAGGSFPGRGGGGGGPLPSIPGSGGGRGAPAFIFKYIPREGEIEDAYPSR